MQGPSSTAQREPPAGPGWVWMIVYSLLTAVGVAALQARHYAHTLRWSQQDFTLAESASLHWVVASACAWALLPGALLAGGLLWGRRTRAAWTVFALWSTAVLFWLAVDLRVDVVTAKHALDYWRFLSGAEPWQWAGGLGEILWAVLFIGVGMAIAGAAGVAAAYGLARRGHPGGRLGAGFATAAFGLCLLGPALFVGAASHPLALRRLAQALPLPVPLLQRRSGWSDGRDALVGELDRGLTPIYAGRADELAREQPVASPSLGPGPFPNVLVIVIESFRHDSVDPRWMPRVHAFAQRHALRSARHYATSHASHLGLFSLLFGKSPLVYETTLDAKVAAQLPHTLRRNGYRSSLLSSSALDWQRMEDFLSERNFDEIVIEALGPWPGRDARTLAHLRQRIDDSQGGPRFLLAFLMSTHYRYAYPPTHERHLPVVETGVLSLQRLLASKDTGARYRQGLRNRYRNSLAYLDDQLGAFLETLELDRNIVMITGDHGESFYEDGSWLHGSRLSDAQLRVPWLVAGPGIPTGIVAGPTSHIDALPTLLHAAAAGPIALQGAQGRDLLGTAPTAEAELLLVGTGTGSRSLLLLRGNERLHLRIDPRADSMQTLGFLDDEGGYRIGDPQSRDDPVAWLEAVDRQLERAAR